MMEKRLPDWLLERLALGELPPDQMAELRRRLEAEEGGPERLAALERSNREILETHDPARLAEAIRQRADGPRSALQRAAARDVSQASAAPTQRVGARGVSQVDAATLQRAAATRTSQADAAAETVRPLSDGAAQKNRDDERAPSGWWRKLAIGGSFAGPIAAALLIIALLPHGELPLDPAQSGLEETRLKGLKPQLLVHRRGAEEPERLGDGSEVRAHELLQLSYIAAGKDYGVVLSLDGSGVVTLHHPLRGGLASPLEHEGAVPLPNAYELDDAPGFERFVFVSAAEPFSVQEVLDAARELAASPAAATAPLLLPSDREQTSLTLRKPR